MLLCFRFTSWWHFFFFFQAEDGIRDLYVTGVQTCALPISAIRVADSRLQSAHFGGYDGRIGDVRAVQQIVTKFGPDYTFSPSQLESFLFCPFQFFMRYVLKLQPVDERDELEEDYTERGSRVHRVLEQLERMLAQEPGNRLERAEAVIVN